MKILMVCEDFRVGGAQVFALRLANALTKEHKVFLYSHYASYINTELTNRWAPGLGILSANFRSDWIIRKFDRLLYKLRIDFSLREMLIVSHIRKELKRYEIEIVHSHMFKSDYVVAKALHDMNIPLVTTMHGNYESFLKNYLEGTKEVLLNYPIKLGKTLAETDAIAYLTNKNLIAFKEDSVVPTSVHQHAIKKKIYNGFEGQIDKPHSRKELGIASGDQVFGMVARGIPEKGWAVAIDAFRAVNKTGIHLVLVGWSDYVANLSRAHKGNERIHFVGYSGNPLNWIQLFDVGLLPSVYGESLPNVIVEYLYCCKPAIVSDVGESKFMIEADEQKAGFVLPVEEGQIDLHLLSNRMNQYIENALLLTEHSQIAKNAFQKFTMNKCVESYIELYHSTYARRHSASLGHYASV